MPTATQKFSPIGTWDFGSDTSGGMYTRQYSYKIEKDQITYRVKCTLSNVSKTAEATSKIKITETQIKILSSAEDHKKVAAEDCSAYLMAQEPFDYSMPDQNSLVTSGKTYKRLE